MSEMDELRKASGSIEIDDSFVEFLYVVMRNGCPTGVVEEALSQVQGGPVKYTNGWLAEYSKSVADRFREKARHGRMVV